MVLPCIMTDVLEDRMEKEEGKVGDEPEKLIAGALGTMYTGMS